MPSQAALSLRPDVRRSLSPTAAVGRLRLVPVQSQMRSSAPFRQDKPLSRWSSIPFSAALVPATSMPPTDVSPVFSSRLKVSFPAGLMTCLERMT
jgi:hypothetical protein